MIEIKFRGFINEVKEFQWGTVYDMAHAQMRKNDEGKWETVGKDYFSVIGEPGFGKDQQVVVEGKLKTKVFEKRDGSKGLSLEVRATTMTLFTPEKRNEAAILDTWPTASIGTAEQVPF
jgi:hypothetical protein